MLKILIADDSQFYRKVIGDLLKDAGHDVTIVTDGKKALETIRKMAPDLVISDILMPNMDGYALTVELQKDEKLRQTPIILCSGTHSPQKYHDLALNLGATNFIPKDATASEWLELIDRAVNARRATRHPLHDPPAGELKLYNETLIKELEERCLLLEREVGRQQKRLQELTKGLEQLLQSVKSP